ncbi:probable inactive serine/threonine-protein kinase fnkC [Durio zibethinus]|uniref:Probable inactive serine/threonine-protein kinase fnkC n=1 Tax=Durio zibethinus TaxID=66656 RepID=A0A6P6B9I9_DURZI|nr:probable inactive serine/threonine-protein kinase fnkC [Durio zibethinus]XP_022773695.1 probable inactive serine/threonine-protein kinase fnkC [Durio zibethinus]
MKFLLMFAGIKGVTRDLPPAHYLFNIESFSLLVNTGLEKYESHAFEVGGYNWRLSLYPNGNKKSNGFGFISLYLQIEGTENLPRTWEVNASFRFFVLDQIRDKYLTIEEDDGAIKRFYNMKTEWGNAQLLPLHHFNDASNGYLVDDCCTFGVEIFVIKQTGKLERLSMTKDPPNNTITFTLQNYSKSYSDFYTSDAQTIGDSNWKLKVYPRGIGSRKNIALSVYLELVEARSFPPKRQVYAQYKLRVKDRYNSNNNRENTASNWFTAESFNWGYPYFMSLLDLQDKSKDYIWNDTLIVEAEIIIVSKVKLFL